MMDRDKYIKKITNNNNSNNNKIGEYWQHKITTATQIVNNWMTSNNKRLKS
jgi:hypothetical protein